jgi:nitroreductase
MNSNQSRDKDFFKELCETRQSTRRYDNRPVEREKILECIEAARLAPSACNSQPWHFVVAEDKELCERLAALTSNKIMKMNMWVKDVPVMIAVVTEPSNMTASIGAFLKRKEYNVIDMSMATEHFCLRAASLGLGSCILGWFNERKVKKILKIPMRKKVLLLITLGYPMEGDRIRKKARKPLREIVSFGSYQAD